VDAAPEPATPALPTKIQWGLTKWPPEVFLPTDTLGRRRTMLLRVLLLATVAFLAGSLGNLVNSNPFKREVWGPALFGPGTTPSSGLFDSEKCVGGGRVCGVWCVRWGNQRACVPFVR
jgi:hypothetical protein